MNGGWGGVKMLPVGYRFDPTDEELVIYYLKRKVHGLPLPASIIPDYNRNYYLAHPSHLPLSTPGKTMQKRYFFYNNSKDKYQSDNNRSNYKRAAAAACGFWRSIGKEKQIVATTTTNCSDQCACSQAQSAALLAVRKTLVFCGRNKKKTRHHQHPYRYRHQNSTSPRWFMHEYHLLDSQVLGNSWVLCSVFQKRRKPTIKKRGRQTSTLDDTESCGHLPNPCNMFE